MYSGTTVLGEFSELQYSLSPSYQAARLLVLNEQLRFTFYLWNTGEISSFRLFAR